MNGLVTLIVGVPDAVCMVRVLNPSSSHPNEFVGLPNVRLPMVRPVSRVTVVSWVRFGVANVAVLPTPSATTPPVQLAASLQLPPLTLDQLPSAAVAAAGKRPAATRAAAISRRLPPPARDEGRLPKELALMMVDNSYRS